MSNCKQGGVRSRIRIGQSNCAAPSCALTYSFHVAQSLDELLALALLAVDGALDDLLVPPIHDEAEHEGDRLVVDQVGVHHAELVEERRLVLEVDALRLSLPERARKTNV